MSPVIGIRRETRSTWERRAPLTPEAVRRLTRERGVEIVVQPSARRIYHDKEYVRAGATVTNDLSVADVVMGIKEVPPDLITTGTTYVIFSHVIKGQKANMPMLARFLDLGCTLVDYELVRDAAGRRLVFFGKFAGLAGMIDTLWTLGQRMLWEGIETPLAGIRPAHSYDSLAEAKESVRAIGAAIAAGGLPPELTPLVIGIAGYGNVAAGVRELLADLPTVEIEPADVAAVATGGFVPGQPICQVTFKEEHVVVPSTEGGPFDLQHYYRNPERYRGCFAPYLPHLSVLMNCNYWDSRYPRLATRDDLRALYAPGSRPRLKVIGDISCDIDGAVQATTHLTEPGDPVYVYDPHSGETHAGVAGEGPVVLAVDILPTELPRDSSEAFSEILAPFVPTIAKADLGVPLEKLALPAEMLRAIIVHHGQLTPDWAHLESHLKEVKADGGKEKTRPGVGE